MASVKKTTWRSQFLKNVATACLMLAMFFNPLGFDALFKLVMDWTGSYWTTDLLFYGVSLSFAGLYFFFKKASKKH